MNYIKEQLAKLKFNKATLIQEAFFANFDRNMNIVGVSPTGTGKTLAYLLPILKRLDKDKEATELVILLPTNELIFQVQKMIDLVEQEFKILLLYGSIDKERLLKSLKNKSPKIIIATPNKLYEIAQKSSLLKSVKYLVFDEADMMFDKLFLDEIDLLLPLMESAKYYLLSATINNSMVPFIKKYFGNFLYFDVGKKNDLNIEYRLIKIKQKKRIAALVELTKVINPYLAIVFVSKKEDLLPVYEALTALGLKTALFSGSLKVKERKRLIEDIINLKYQYVVSSDLLSRGMDFDVSTIIHYDLPLHNEYFVHRNGRTARMGKSGIVYVIEGEKDSRKIERLKNQGFLFLDYVVTKTGLKKINKEAVFNKELANKIKTIKKPTKVVPNYKKKNKEQIRKIAKEFRRNKNEK